ncbi:MAG: riboflavin biosynthesis protein RibF [Bacteroidales bacterium]|nr:riboflavin biosynthesis protein RibF [Bacteroidales bacterium]
MKILNIEDISALRTKTIVTVGMFDGLHIGHRHLISQLMEQSAKFDLEPVVVTFDCHPRIVMEPSTQLTLLSTEKERLQQLEECGVPTVALIHFTPETAALSACSFVRGFLCGRLNMKSLLLGYDNRFGSHCNNDFDKLPSLATELGFDICRDEAVVLNGVEVSSTKIRQALSHGDIDTANAMLGAPYSLSGTVVHGRHVGTSMGFPTANIMPDDSYKMLPSTGVYALRATVNGSKYRAMANLGSQPTFNRQQQTLEVHLFDFEGDLYDSIIKVEFLKHIRDIRFFNSPSELAEQLSHDKVMVNSFFEKLTTKERL